MTKEQLELELTEWETFPDEQKWNGWVPPRLRAEDKNANSTGKGE